MAPSMRRVAALLSLAAVSRASRKENTGLAQLATEGGLPCTIEVKYGQAQTKDEGIVDSITLTANCKADIHDATLLQPVLGDESGKTLPIGIVGNGADKNLLKAGLHKLRSLRLKDDYFGGSYVGKTFTLTAKTADNVEETASVTIQDPSVAKEAEKAAMEAGGLPCELTAPEVGLQGGGSGFKILVKCTSEVTDLVLTVPKPYGSMRPLVKANALSRLMIVDASKLQSAEFVLTGNTVDGKSGSASVTVKLPGAEAAAPVKEEKTEEKPAVKDVPVVKSPAKAPEKLGNLPCTLKKELVDVEGGSGKGVTFAFECTEEVANPMLKWGSSTKELDNSQPLQGPIPKGTPMELTLDRQGLEGKVFVFQADANGVSGATEAVTV